MQLHVTLPLALKTTYSNCQWKFPQAGLQRTPYHLDKTSRCVSLPPSFTDSKAPSLAYKLWHTVYPHVHTLVYLHTRHSCTGTAPPHLDCMRQQKQCVFWNVLEAMPSHYRERCESRRHHTSTMKQKIEDFCSIKLMSTESYENSTFLCLCEVLSHHFGQCTIQFLC